MTVAILADDLTGACDAAAPFARRGLSTEVVLNVAHLLADDALPAVLAIDVDSRRLGSRPAAARTALAVRAVRARGATLLYKKIDSTLRGHVAAELSATMRAWDAPLAVVCPAFPAVGRWVQGGHLFVDTRGDLGDVAELAGLTRAGIGRRIARLGLDVVGRGEDALLVALEQARRGGARVVVADANTPGHLTALARAATRLDPSALLVGSAGLAGALAEEQGMRPRPALPLGEGWARAHDPSPMAWLVVRGSQTEATQHQIVELARAGAEVIELDVDELLARRRVADAAGARAARVLWAGRTPVLSLVVSPDASGVRSRGGRPDDRAARALGRACLAVVTGAQPAGLFLTGGLTARACLLALGARGLRLEQEPLPGIAAGRAIGGVWDGRAVITKAGGFGAPDAIKRLVRLRRG